ncbi:MAG TPA: o-succinylbenzoate synthase [Actinomycetota bacterium]|nr:o-succinylbenzoate synthase [Actinomycetota bacterium]
MSAWAIPMRVPFRGVSVREGVLLRGDGGWGEFSPFPEYGPETTRHWLAAAREAAYGDWPAPVRARVPVNVTVPALGPDDAFALVAGSGCTTAKVKVAEGDDVARVAAVRAALGPRGKLRVDANGAWDVETAARAIDALAEHDLEYVEQPVRTLEEMARLRRLVDVPLAADESVRTAADPLRVAGLEAADVVVLKAQPLGGVRRALDVARAAGLPAVVSSALETSVGVAAGVALAAALPELPYACGLGTVALLDGDVVRDPLVPVDGALDVRRPAPDAALLDRHALDDDGVARWRARVDAAARGAP